MFYFIIKYYFINKITYYTIAKTSHSYPTKTVVHKRNRTPGVVKSTLLLPVKTAALCQIVGPSNGSGLKCGSVEAFLARNIAKQF